MFSSLIIFFSENIHRYNHRHQSDDHATSQINKGGNLAAFGESWLNCSAVGERRLDLLGWLTHIQ